MAFVYWARLKKHTDILTQGYVGYTSRAVETRYKKHVSDATREKGVKYTFQYAILKYGDDIVVSAVIEGSAEYCLEMELKLRPEKYIGWNQQKGGSKPPSPKGRTVSIESRAKSSASHKATLSKMTLEERSDRYSYLKGIVRSEQTNEKNRIAQIGKHVSWEIKNANKEVWASAEVILKYTLENPSHKNKRIAKAMCFTEGQLVAISKKIASGWIPSLDSAYMAWLSEYKQKETHVT